MSISSKSKHPHVFQDSKIINQRTFSSKLAIVLVINVLHLDFINWKQKTEYDLDYQCSVKKGWRILLYSVTLIVHNWLKLDAHEKKKILGVVGWKLISQNAESNHDTDATRRKECVRIDLTNFSNQQKSSWVNRIQINLWFKRQDERSSTKKLWSIIWDSLEIISWTKWETKTQLLSYVCVSRQTSSLNLIKTRSAYFVWSLRHSKSTYKQTQRIRVLSWFFTLWTTSCPCSIRCSRQTCITYKNTGTFGRNRLAYLSIQEINHRNKTARKLEFSYPTRQRIRYSLLHYRSKSLRFTKVFLSIQFPIEVSLKYYSKCKETRSSRKYEEAHPATWEIHHVVRLS